MTKTASDLYLDGKFSSFVEANFKHMLPSLLAVLQLVIDDNRKNQRNFGRSNSQGLNKVGVAYTSKSMPQMPISQFCESLVKAHYPQPSTFLVSMMLVDEVIRKAKLVMDDYNVHRLFVSCFLLGFKLNEDEPPSNLEIGRSGGLELEELNSLEVTTLNILGWSPGIEAENYEKYCKIMIKYFKHFESLKAARRRHEEVCSYISLENMRLG